jgi:hypothetical protein
LNHLVAGTVHQPLIQIDRRKQAAPGGFLLTDLAAFLPPPRLTETRSKPFLSYDVFQRGSTFSTRLVQTSPDLADNGADLPEEKNAH